jgi:uncharacterized protein (TIGR00288 family)
LAHHERVNIAVFIDFDNIEIGVRTTLNEHFDVGIILEALKERGEVVTKIAYADWTRAGEYSRHLTQHAIRLVQRNLTPGGDKNGADINLALDALEMVFTHTHINAYVIVGGDSDFLSLVEKLKQYDKKVFVIGGRAFTSVILQKNCHEFIAYENLVRKPAAARGGRPSAPTMVAQPIGHAFPIVRRALKILADREVSPQTGLLKSTLLQLDSTFSERNYGASSFLDFTEKLAQAGLVALKHSGRSVMVELNPSFTDDGSPVQPPTPRPEGDTAEVPVAAPAGEGQPVRPAENTSRPAEEGAPRVEEQQLARLGDQAEGVRLAGQHLGAAVNARWPMYLRNAKQILRAASFDERRYGFGGLIELLKGCQRDGLVRMERDRRGGLRVFQGPALVRTASSTPAPVIFDIENELQAEGEASPGNEAPPAIGSIPVQEVLDVESDADPLDIQPAAVVDTTAELLGRATGRRSRSRSAAAPEVDGNSITPRASRGTRKTAARKPVATSRGRGRKSSDS